MGMGITKVTPTLAVTDLKKAQEFYGQTLGLEQVEGGGGDEGAMFQAGEGSYLYVYERAPSGSTATACEFAVEDVDKVVGALRQKGVKFEDYEIPEMKLKTVDGIASMESGEKVAWFLDPSGNILAVSNAMHLMAQRGKPRKAAEEAGAPAMH